MDEIVNIKKIIRNLELNSSDAYYYEVGVEKLIKAVRKNIKKITKALIDDAFTPLEILYLAEISPQYTSLSGLSDLIDSIALWLEKNQEEDSSGDIRGYIEEAKRTYSSLFQY